MVQLPADESVPEHEYKVVKFYCNNQTVYTHTGAVGVCDLERMAARVAGFANLDAVPFVQQLALNRVRQLFNMEFKLVCDRCATAHYQDEISAPER